MNSGDTQIDWAAWQRRALICAVVGLAACAAGWFLLGEEHRAAFFRAYLVGYCLWIGASLGSLAWMLIFQLTGGAWGVMVRRQMEAAARCLPLMAILFLPIALSVPSIYEWAQPALVEGDKILKMKEPYLNVEFFQIRQVIYFVVWIALAWLISRYSRSLETGYNETRARRYRKVGAFGLVLYATTITFTSIDWVMSLTPHWFSTMFPVIFAVGEFLTAMALAILLLNRTRTTPDLARICTPARFQDLGSLLLALTMLWAYTAFSQFMLIWAANLPEENAWFQPRLFGGWKLVGIVLMIFHFAVPFFLLLLKENKRDINRLKNVAVLLLVMRVVDLTYQIVPVIPHKGHPMLTMAEQWPSFVLVAASVVGIGGAWFYMFVAQIKKLPLVASQDPRTLELLPHE